MNRSFPAGVFGAAAACGRLLGLSEAQMTWALGLAAAQPVGLREMFGSMTKSFHPGRAAQNGLTAALLAGQGFTADETALEGKDGFAQALARGVKWSEVTEGLGTRFEAALNTYKPFACGIVIHPSIDGCIQLREQVAVADVERIVLRVHPLVLELTGKKTPQTGLEGKFSVYHSCAVGLLYGRAGEAEYADVGGSFGATCTLLTHYLHAAGVVPDRALATALFYGVKSDTRDLGREVSENDVWAYSYLVGLCDMPIVSQIEHPRLPRSYFQVLMRAIRQAEVYDDVVVCDLGSVYVPDLVAETADRLVSAEKVRWAIVVGDYEDHIYVSIRVNDRRYSAGKLVREVVERYERGSAGGHGSMAGMRVPHPPSRKSAASRTRARRKLLRELALATGLSPAVKPEPFAGLENGGNGRN